MWCFNQNGDYRGFYIFVAKRGLSEGAGFCFSHEVLFIHLHCFGVRWIDFLLLPDYYKTRSLSPKKKIIFEKTRMSLSI